MTLSITDDTRHYILGKRDLKLQLYSLTRVDVFVEYKQTFNVAKGIMYLLIGS